MLRVRRHHVRFVELVIVMHVARVGVLSQQDLLVTCSQLLDISVVIINLVTEKDDGFNMHFAPVRTMLVKQIASLLASIRFANVDGLVEICTMNGHSLNNT